MWLLTFLRIFKRRPNLRQSEQGAWSVINAARDEYSKLTEVEGDLTGRHKPRLTDAQKDALHKGKTLLIRKAKPGLARLKAIEVVRWQNGWAPIVLRLSDESLPDKTLSVIDEQLYRHTRLGSALNKRWRYGIPGYEGLFDSGVRSLKPSVLTLAVTLIRIREWVSVRRTLGVLGEISAFREELPEIPNVPAEDISEWLGTIYDRDAELERLTHETIRLEAEEDVDRLLGEGNGG